MEAKTISRVKAISRVIIEFNINDAQESIPGFAEMDSLLTELWSNAKNVNASYSDRVEYYELRDEMWRIVSYFTITKSFSNKKPKFPFRKDSLRILELYRSILTDLYNEYGYIFEYMSFSPYADAQLNAQYFAYGFEVRNIAELLSDMDKFEKMQSDIKCSVETYADVM